MNPSHMPNFISLQYSHFGASQAFLEQPLYQRRAVIIVTHYKTQNPFEP